MSDLMENRRLQGKDGINKKLKGNQEFLYKNTLSPEAPIWTKWHQNRLLESEMTKDFSNAPNAKYMSVSDVHNPQFFQLYFFASCSKLRRLKGCLVKIIFIFNDWPVFEARLEIFCCRAAFLLCFIMFLIKDQLTLASDVFEFRSLEKSFVRNSSQNCSTGPLDSLSSTKR